MPQESKLLSYLQRMSNLHPSYVCNCPDSFIRFVSTYILLNDKTENSKTESNESTIDTDNGNVQGDDNIYGIEEINCLKSFTQSEEKVDFLSVRNRVTGKISSLLSDAGQSKDLNNLLQLEKWINSAHSFFYQ